MLTFWKIGILPAILIGIYACNLDAKESKPTPPKDTTKEQSVNKKKATPKINIRFLYVMCNDVKAIRTFYTELLGMNETSFKDEEKFGWVSYYCEGLEYMFFRWDSKLPVPKEFNWQPGDSAGTGAGMSLSIEVPGAAFKKTVKRMRKAKVKALTKDPTWRQKSYWGWKIKDPMGNTIEIYMTPKTKPKGKDTPVWKD